jgi:TP901 family phage tail tape measure protein
VGQNISFDVIARDRASSTFSRIGRSSDTAASRLVKFGKSTAGLVGITSLTTAAVGFVKVGGEYVGSLNKIQTLQGATDAQMARAAKTLEGQSTAYAKMGQTVGDAAGGVVELSKAGLSLHKSLQAVNATMVLAKAGEMGVADASSLVANTLNTFHMKASKAGDIANYLANAANISSADVSDLAESFKYVAPVAAATGVSLAQTNAILAELSNSGIAASNAGTGFRKFLLSLQAPSGAAAKDLKDLNVEIFDASGKMKPLGSVIDQLNGKLSKLTDQQRQRVLKDIFGLQGLSSAQVILDNGKKGLEDYTKGVKKAGAAQKLAESASKGFTGTLAALRAEVISDAQAAYRELSPSLDTAAKKLLEFVQGMKSGKGAGGDFVHVLKDLATVAKMAVDLIDGLPGPVKRFGIEALIAYGVIRKLTSATGGWGASLTTTVAKVKQFGAEMTYAETRTQRVTAVSQAMGGVLRNVAGAGGMMLLADSTGKAGTKMGALEAAAGGALSGAALGAFAGPVGAGVGAALGGLAAGALNLMHNTKGAGDAASTAIGKWQTYAATLDQVTGATTEATRAAALKAAADSGLLTRTRSLGIADRTVVNALVNGGKARDRVIAISKREISATDEAIAAKKRELAANIAIANDMSVPLAKQTAAAENVQANRKELQSLQDLRAAQVKDVDKVLDGVSARRKAVLETQKNAAAINDLTGKLKGIPPNIRTKIKNEGIIPTTKGIIELSEKYRLTPKQVRTVITASGAQLTQKQIDHLVNTVVAYEKLNPKPKIDADTTAAAAKIQALINAIGRVRDKTVHITADTNANVAEHASGGGGKKKPGAPRYAGDFGRGSSRMLDDNMRAAATKTMTIKRALDKFGNALSTVTDQIASLKDLRQSFLSTFQADNLFGADLSGGGGAAALVDFEAKQAAQASQLLADVQNVISRGLSKELVSQLQSQGLSGALQLHALAGGSNAQIQQLNDLNAQTSSALSAAGLLAGNTVRGGNIDADIARAQREEVLLNKLVDRLEKLQHADYVVVEIDGEKIVAAIKKRNVRKGVKTAGI